MDDGLLIPIRLSKEGYGTPQQIADMRADYVLGALHYSAFLSDYEETYSHINKSEK